MSTMVWHVFVLVMSFNVMSVCTHVGFCWAYDSCSSYPDSVHVLVYAMRMGDFSYGLFCGVCLMIRLNSQSSSLGGGGFSCEMAVLDENAPLKSETAVSS